MKKNKFVYRIIYGIIMAFFMIGAFSITASADIGDKRSYDIKVINAPEGYTFALLGGYYNDQNDHETTTEKYDPSKETVEEYLLRFNYEGWVYNDFVGSKEYNPRGWYSYGYMIPIPTRIVIVAADGTVTVSDVIEAKEFHSVLIYDYQANKVTEKVAGRIAYRIFSVLLCFGATLFFEWLIFKNYKFPKTKRNIIAFVVVNAITNLPYNIFFIYFLSRAGWPALFIEAFCEIIIMLFEAICYSFVLHTENGKPEPKCFGYGIVANLFSAFMGVVLYIPYYILVEMIKSFLRR